MPEPAVPAALARLRQWAERHAPISARARDVLAVLGELEQARAERAAAVLAEREACARVCDEAERRLLHCDGRDTAPEDIARAIRARAAPPPPSKENPCQP